MTAPYTKLITPIGRLTVVCRGCLAESGEMKNMYECGIIDDYFTTSAIERTRLAGVSELLCASCEAAMIQSKQFQDRCQLSDKILKTSLAVRAKAKNLKKNHVFCTIQNQKLIVKITAPRAEAKILLPCPFNCKERFYKKSDLHCHLRKCHNVSEQFEIDLLYFCPELECAYHANSEKKKSFCGRKFLNQHINKVHKVKTFFCNDCYQCFALESDLQRHLKVCSFVYICQICESKYDCHEKLMVHLKRKHPTVHRMYKNEKAEQRKSKISEFFYEPKKMKTNDDDRGRPVTETVVTEEVTDDTVTETWHFNEEGNKDGDSCQMEIPETCDCPDKTAQPIDICDSPKKSSSTQIPENIRNDVTLPSWQSRDFETKTDEISTQVAFEDLLSLKSQNSEDMMFFSDPVSLSDIQTQTFAEEFGLSRSNKETQSCKTQSPDLSIKETQTCYCHYDSPKPNFRLFDSLTLSPASINHTSAETQTADHRHSVRSDVMLSFSSAETQTCFEDACSEGL